MVKIKLANTTEELQGILDLQKKNLSNAISTQELEEQGYVTVDHSFELLNKMNDELPSVVALKNNKVVAYSLTMTKKFSSDIPVLVPMFQLIDSLLFKDQHLANVEYLVGGQVCIDKEYRSQGIFYKLYNKARDAYQDIYPLMITEVSLRNPRSIKAHQNCGFKIIHEYNLNGEDWDIMAWNWNM